MACDGWSIINGWLMTIVQNGQKPDTYLFSPSVFGVHEPPPGGFRGKPEGTQPSALPVLVIATHHAHVFLVRAVVHADPGPLALQQGLLRPLALHVIQEDAEAFAGAQLRSFGHPQGRREAQLTTHHGRRLAVEHVITHRPPLTLHKDLYPTPVGQVLGTDQPHRPIPYLAAPLFLRLRAPALLVNPVLLRAV